MQNKPNFPEAKMSVSSVLAKNYENKSNPTLGENKPNSNPNKPNCWKAQNERKLSINKALRKYLGLWGPEKQSQTNPICQKAMNERNRLFNNELRK
jgi:hypothetical protein